MNRAAFIRQARAATGDAVLSATNEAGLRVSPAVASTSNRGSIVLGGAGVPRSSVVLDLALTAGGNVTEYDVAGQPGAALRWKNSTDSDYRGYTDTQFLTYARPINVGGATNDYPGTSRVRELRNGYRGFCRTKRVAAGTSRIQFVYAASRRGAWTEVTLTTAAIETGSAPDFIVLPDGRLILFYFLADYTVRAVYSDDHGATWATWSSRTNIGPLDSGSRQLSAELVDDAVLLVASMAPGATTRDAYVGWSFNGGSSFDQVGDGETWGPARTTVSRLGTVFVAASNQVAAAVALYEVDKGAAPVTSTATISGTMAIHALNVGPGICTRDDGVMWLFGGSTSDPTSLIEALYSPDHGRTWLTPGTGSDVSGPEGVVALGTSTAGIGFKSIAAGWWDDRVVLTLVSNVTTANRDDGNYEVHLGGWESVTEAERVGASDATYAESTGGYLPMDLPNNMDWTATNVGAGATVTLGDSGLNIVAGGATNTWYAAPTTLLAATGHNSGVRVKGAAFVASGGSLADDRLLVVAIELTDTANRQLVKIRATANQIEAFDGTGTSLGASAITVGGFSSVFEYFISFNEDASATGRASGWYRLSSSDVWVSLFSNATVSNSAGTTARLLFGGTAAGATDWTVVYGPFVADDDNEISTGFTNPTDLEGRKLSAHSAIHLTAGHKVIGAGGAGVQGDVYTLTTDAAYSKRNLFAHLRPSQRHQATGDNATHDVVFDFGAGNAPPVDYVGLVGTNMRQAKIGFNTANSWGSPPAEVNLDATIYRGPTTAAGLGYVRTDGAPFVPHAFQSEPLRRFFLQSSGVIYEIVDNTENEIMVDGVDLSASSGAMYVFGDRMGGFLPAQVRYRYARLSLTAQQTADDAYRLASLLVGTAERLTVPPANGYVDELDPEVAEFLVRGGSRFTSVLGTTPKSLRIAFDPIDGGSSDQLRRLEALYRAVRGSHEVVGLVRDVDRPNDLLLVQLFGTLAKENVYGNGRDELARVGQIIAREVL